METNADPGFGKTRHRQLANKEKKHQTVGEKAPDNWTEKWAVILKEWGPFAQLLPSGMKKDVWAG